MAIVATHKTRRTKSGLFVKPDRNIGLLVHSPFTGLNYAVHQSYQDSTLRWLEKRTGQAPSDAFRFTLGAGWAIDKSEARHTPQHLLPTASDFSVLQGSDTPILINWFLTGRCPLACVYCYAEDLMRREELEPALPDIEQYAETILELNPLVVVLTGGDPLFSPHLSKAIKLLSGKVGVVLDTSGFTLTSGHVKLFKDYGVSVRISFDSERPAVNQRQRPFYREYPQLARKGVTTTEAAVDALCKCLEANVSVTVQTVATKKTANDLVALGDKLYRLGVVSWRIFKVVDSEARHTGYLKLVGTHTDTGKKIIGKQANGPYDFSFDSVRTAAANNWNHSIAIQIDRGEVPNAVILVGPDGTFYTESNLKLGKILLDQRRPKAPSMKALKAKINMLAHAERYLNLTGND
jgi:MoaA/NifB/PqqE/SkfB family radical SAM enzyme